VDPFLFSRCLVSNGKGWSGSVSLYMENSWDAPVPPKRPDLSALADVSAPLPLLPFTLVWLSKQTMNRATPLFYSATKQKIERFHSNYQTQNEMSPFLETEIESLHSN
jgi:hypothetical protein